MWYASSTTVRPSKLNGDYQHLWPYGVNGANEDNGSRDLYIANSLVCQALCEDGLPATSNINFAAPYYAFDQEDTIKYYIKSESESYGLYTSFLKENDDKTLNWTTMTTAEASLNDSAAWYVTFNPKTCYYTFTNVATKTRLLIPPVCLRPKLMQLPQSHGCS